MRDTVQDLKYQHVIGMPDHKEVSQEVLDYRISRIEKAVQDCQQLANKLKNDKSGSAKDTVENANTRIGQTLNEMDKFLEFVKHEISWDERIKYADSKFDSAREWFTENSKILNEKKILDENNRQYHIDQVLAYGQHQLNLASLRGSGEMEENHIISFESFVEQFEQFKNFIEAEKKYMEGEEAEEE